VKRRVKLNGGNYASEDKQERSSLEPLPSSAFLGKDGLKTFTGVVCKNGEIWVGGCNEKQAWGGNAWFDGQEFPPCHQESPVQTIEILKKKILLFSE